MSFPVIDSHQHVWDPERVEYSWLDDALAPINRVTTLEELLPELRAAGVNHTIQVQSADNHEDTQLMRESADAHPDVVSAIVGYAPLDRPEELAATLEEWKHDSRMVGLRNLIHTKEDTDWLLRDDVREGLGVLEAFDYALDFVGVLPRHLELVPVLSERHPGLRIVIDHLNKPPVGLEDSEPWWSLIGAAADNPRVTAKVSGLYSATDDIGAWSTDSVRPVFERALDVFGPSRLMYGGDWPISILAGGYTRVWNGLAPLFDDLSSADREQILGRTAAEFYRINPARLVESSDEEGTRAP